MSKVSDKWHAMHRECSANDINCKWFRDWDGKDAVNFTYGGAKAAKLAVDHEATARIVSSYYPEWSLKRSSWTSIIIDIGNER